MPTAKRYFRILALDENWQVSDTYTFQLVELELFRNADLTDQIPLSTPAASSTYSASFLPGNAVDGSLSTRWSTASYTTEYHWWSCDMGGIELPDSMRFWNRWARHPKRAALQLSDSPGSGWETFAEIDTPDITEEWINFYSLGAGGKPRLIDGFGCPLMGAGLIQ